MCIGMIAGYHRFMEQCIAVDLWVRQVFEVNMDRVQDNRWIGWMLGSLFFGFAGWVIFLAVDGNRWVGLFFSNLCHQKEERCYQIAGVPMMVCVRCLWIYLGLAMGHWVFNYWRIGMGIAKRLLVVAMILVLLDVIVEQLGFYENWFVSRGISGFLLGFISSRFLLEGVSLFWLELKTKRKNKHV